MENQIFEARKLLDYTCVAMSCVQADWIPVNFNLSNVKYKIPLRFFSDLTFSILETNLANLSEPIPPIDYEFYTVEELVNHLNNHLIALLQASTNLGNICKTAFLSHSALSTLFKLQNNNGFRAYNLLVNQRNATWIEDNIKDFDHITQDLVRQTGLVGKLWGADVRRMNNLRDNEIYLLCEHTSGIMPIFQDIIDNIEDCELFKIIKAEIMSSPNISDDDKNQLWQLAFKINQIMGSKKSNRNYSYRYNMAIDQNSFTKLEVI